jgi:hypothetical protein
MKKYLLAFVFLCNLSFANAQLLNMMPDTNMKWREFSLIETVGQNERNCNVFQLIGDTLIDSLLYKKIYLLHDTLDSITMYMGAIREDSINKVYIIPSNYTDEIIFYDFSLNIGETFKINTINFDGTFDKLFTEEIKVIDTLTITLLNQQRRVIKVESGSANYIYWIEGIGTNHGLFYNKLVGGINRTALVNFNLVSLELQDSILLTCAEISTLFHTVCEYECIDYLTTKNIESAIFKTHIYPNPNSGSFTLQLESATSAETQLRVFDSMGKIVYSDKLQIPQGKSNTEVHLDNVSKGIYLIQLNIGNEISNHRMVVN